MSDDSTYLGVFFRVFDDLVKILPEYSPREALRDREYCISRVRAEGLAFVTKTLPALAKALEAALESGTFVPIASFKKAKGRATPCFLRVLFKEIFDEQGDLLGNPSSCAVRCVRQVCYFMYKFDSDYPSDLVEKVVKDFVDTDESLTHCEELDREQRLLLTIASSYVFRIFRDFDPLDIRPRPGPGASATGSHRSKRFEPLTHFSQIHEQYPYYRYFFMGTSHLLDRASAYRNLPRKAEATSVLRTVPKDSRGPRIICMEEQEMMFLQQGLGDAMREHVMRHRLCGGHVNFDNQEINRNLAQMSSIDRSFATLDMKEASDRISKDLVRLIFVKLPKLRDCLMALSAPNIQLPSGRSIRARKFAPMGSSLCFPIMSVVHYALAVASIHRATGRRTSLIAKDVYVYGDDIIVKSEYTEPLFTDFPKFGLMFNRGKSFKNGHFRESCGMDAFRGVDVSPQRLKRRYFDGQDPRNVSAVMDMHNALYDKGFVGMASMLQVVTESRYGSFPYVSKDSDVLGWQHKPPLSPDVIDIISYEGSSKDCSFLCNLLVTPEERKQFELLTPIWDSDLHDYTISARVMRTEPECSMLGGWEQLMRSNLQAHRSSARLDGRWSRKFIEYQRQPLSAIYGGSSKFLPR